MKRERSEFNCETFLYTNRSFLLSLLRKNQLSELHRLAANLEVFPLRWKFKLPFSVTEEHFESHSGGSLSRIKTNGVGNT